MFPEFLKNEIVNNLDIIESVDINNYLENNQY